MKVLHMRVGMVGTNCYLVYDEKSGEGVVIDPGDNGKDIVANIKKSKVKLQYVLLTHAHFDHILGLHDVVAATGAKVVLHEADEGLMKYESMGEFRAMVRDYIETPVDIRATEGTEIHFGDLTAVYLHTPGHTPGSCTIRIGDCLFTGDTMFRHECGRCDLPGGDFGQMLQSLKRLSELPGDYQVLPGHEGISTLGEERKYNPYVLQALGK